MQQHILIVITDGEFQGASITTDKGDPAPMELSSLARLIPAVNAAAMAANADLSAQVAALTTYRDAMVGKVQAALQSGDPAQFVALGVEFLTPEQEKRKAELAAEIAAKQAELQALG